MGLITKKTESVDVVFSKEDIALLLTLVGTATIQVKDIEKTYHLIIKLQKTHGSFSS